MKSWFVLSFLSILSLAACQLTPSPTPREIIEPTGITMKTTPTTELTRTPVTSRPTATKPPPIITGGKPTLQTATSQPTGTQFPVCVIINYGEYAQVEIVAPSGQRIMIDVHDPAKLSSQADQSDVLLTTHGHWDHLNEDFQTNFPGNQLFIRAGELTASNVRIQGIASAHNQGDQLKPKDGTNYIYLVEFDGLRIAHLGDIGQTDFSEEQLAILGKIDIAITQINNPYSDMNAENRKGIHLMQQLRPRLVIATHMNLDTVKLAVTEWESYYVDSSSVPICKADLVEDVIQFLLLGDSVETMIRYIELEKWGKR